jgi:hypothetical protein
MQLGRGRRKERHSLYAKEKVRARRFLREGDFIETFEGHLRGKRGIPEIP